MTSTKTPAPQSADDEGRALWAEVDATKAAAQNDDADAQPPSNEAGDAEATTTDAEADATPPSDEGRGADGEDEVDWSTVPDPVRRKFEQTTAQHEQEIKRHARRQALLEQRLREMQSTPPAQPAPAARDRAEADPFAEEYPDIANWLQQQVKPLQETIQRLTSEQQAKVQEQLDQNQQRVAEAIPEGFFAKHGKDFADWVETEASVADHRAYKANLQGFVDPDGAIRVVQSFLRATGSASSSPPPSDDGAHRQNDRRARQLASASSPRTQSRSAAAGIPRDGDPESLWKMTKV